ncbi:MAG TPA: DUF4199 domain-containing protein [Bacteroidales bacterium]|nr:DUF4199 domain-containing protein [Bacteroidales bacterium]HPS17342.1 DUF4199 domain-containing protein [Bacteroidales bacterium]
MEPSTETKKISVARNALNYGFLLGITLIILSLLFYILNVDYQSVAQYISIVIMIVGMIIGILAYRKNNNGFITYGQSLGNGVLIGLFSAILVSIYTIIFFTLIDPGMIDVILRQAEEKMIEKNPNMTDEQIEMAMSYSRKFMTPLSMAIWGTIMSTVYAFVASLIISIFTRKVDNSFEANFR